MTTGNDNNRLLEKRARRAGFASFIGTMIEWYDFYVYGLAASLVFGPLFFPPDLDPGVATMLSFATLWVGFAARPVGGIIFGHFGDRIGRKAALVATLMMMGIATFLIGLLPTYATIGIWAPVALVILRILQGVAVGGEWGGAVLIASENAPAHKRILYAAFAQQGSPVGNLLATLTFFLLSTAPQPDFILSGGWRIPFLLSAALIVIGLFIRMQIEDSQEVKELIEQNRSSHTFPVAEAIRGHWKLILLATGSLPIIYVTYFKSNFAVAWATGVVGYDTRTFLGIITISVVVQCLTQPFGAVIASRMDLRKAVLLITLPEVLLLPFMFYAIQTQIYWLAVLAMAIATVPHGMFYSAIAGILARSFPARVRYTALSLANQISAMTIGGATPFVAQLTLQKSGTIFAVAALSTAYTVISILCVLALLKRTGFDAGQPSIAEEADRRALIEK
jgi:MFS family permease